MMKPRVPSFSRPVLMAFLAALFFVTFGVNGPALAAGAPISGGSAKAAKTAMESWSIGWNTGNLDLIVEAVGNKGFYWDASLPPEGIKGKELHDYAALLFKAFPDSKFSYNHVKYTKKAVYWEWTWKATHTGAFAGKAPTNKTIMLSDIDVIRARKDGSVSIKSYWNELALLKAIGAAE